MKEKINEFKRNEGDRRGLKEDREYRVDILVG
jgi:hypothetical protein